MRKVTVVAAASLPKAGFVLSQVMKIGRDAILYVESLIESIIGGLEGLINILDSEGGFGALETQFLPEQAALYLNEASRVSIPPSKSPKGAVGFPLPGHESYPENNSAIKMLEAAMQRLTNLFSVLNDMEPICVLNHVFVLREIVEACTARIINIEMFAAPGLWIIVQAEKLNLSSKAQLLGAQVVVHYHGLQSQDPGLYCTSRKR